MTKLNDKELKLELVQVIFRHGARTLLQDELNLCKFSDTPMYEASNAGQLTNEGKMQVYDLGIFLRGRYKNFLSEHYKADEVYAYSSDTCRTKMSLQLVLAGLYPPVGHAAWNSNLMWSPATFIYVPIPLDILLRYWRSPRCDDLRVEIHQSQDFRNKLAKYSDFLAFLAAKTKIDFVQDILKTYFFRNVLLEYERLNLPLPDWYEAETKDRIKELSSLALESFTFALQLKKLGVGPLMKALIGNMNLTEANVNPRKIYLYSGHDVNLMLLAKSHHIHDFFPETGSALIIEKLRDSNGRIYVRLLRRTGSGSVTTLTIGDHEEFCPIDDYLRIVEPVVPSESEIDEMLEDLSVENVRSLFFSDSFVRNNNQ